MAPPKINVIGSHLLDTLGNFVYLKGVDLDSGQWWDNTSIYSEQQFIYMKNWGVNAVRIGIQAYSLEQGVMNNASFLTRLDNMIAWAQKYGMYVILAGWMTTLGKCPHGVARNYVNHYMSVDWTWEQWYAWYEKLANRYKGKNFIYDLFNEPLYWPWADHQNRMRTVIDKIHAIDPDAICMVEHCGSAGWETQSLGFERNYPISRPNVIYSIHDYGYHHTDNSKTSIRSKLEGTGQYQYDTRWVLDHGMPVHATEFGPGYYTADGSYSGGANYPWNDWMAIFLRNFMSVMNEDGYAGYTAWRWVAGGWTCEKILVDYNGNPSPYGVVLKEGLTPVSTYDVLLACNQAINFTVNGGQYPQGTTLQVPRGSLLNINVPPEVQT